MCYRPFLLHTHGVYITWCFCGPDVWVLHRGCLWSWGPDMPEVHLLVPQDFIPNGVGASIAA